MGCWLAVCRRLGAFLHTNKCKEPKPLHDSKHMEGTCLELSTVPPS